MGACCSDCWYGLRSSGYEEIPERIGDLGPGKLELSGTEISYQTSSLQQDCGTPPQLPDCFHQKYAIGHLIGKGTTSDVYLVRPKRAATNSFEPALACKVICKGAITQGLQDLDFDPTEVQLWREVEILKRLQHPNVVQYFDGLETTSHLVIITEHLEGGELYDYILNNGALAEPFACRILYGVFSALSYLHDQNIVHRDIKAENLIFFKDADGQDALKLIDFGFSTIIERRSTGSFMGTGGYIAPEIRQHKDYTTAVDVWSLGVVLFCTLSARLPFGVSLDALPEQIDECRDAFHLEFPSQLFSKVSGPCRRLIKQMLEIDPAKRITAKDALMHPWFKDMRERSRPWSSPHSISTLASEGRRSTSHTSPSPAPFPLLQEAFQEAMEPPRFLQGPEQSASLFDGDPRCCSPEGPSVVRCLGSPVTPVAAKDAAVRTISVDSTVNLSTSLQALFAPLAGLDNNLSAARARADRKVRSCSELTDPITELGSVDAECDASSPLLHGHGEEKCTAEV